MSFFDCSNLTFEYRLLRLLDNVDTEYLRVHENKGHVDEDTML